MKTLLTLAAIAAAAAAGYGYGRWYAKPAAGERKPLYWVDPMHPWYKSDHAGLAPDCHMPMVPVYPGEEARYQAGANHLPAGTVQVDSEKQQLIGVEYGTVDYGTLATSVHAAARVALDETRLTKVHSKLEGWIEEVFADFVGQQVHKGDPLLTIYSPELLATQQEFLLAGKAQHLLHDNPVHEMAGSTEDLVAAARKRLELWDFTSADIARVAATGKPIEDVTLRAPIDGFLLDRNAYPKQRVMPDTTFYTIADLSTVWVIADVYEYEAAAIRLGTPASLTLPAFPGRTFRGKVSYILPQVDPATRTLKVRIEFANPDFLLKPDMFGEVEFQSGGGRRLVVPATAVLNSGDRQTVFVDRGNGFLEPRAVKIGEQADGRIEILGGLRAGERIVISGNFLLDSESQLKQ
ncbi:MAG: efflux RND transporter periplasmic adaptor subunit [Acidobacteriota bacterium]|nr:efflux RND transporter periplasmic adaptor subunit [Acidobacteriota bacterium]